MKVISILFLVINNTLKHCQAEETVINSDACTAERLKVIDIILITKYVDKNTLPTRKIVVEAFYFLSKISEITISLKEAVTYSCNENGEPFCLSGWEDLEGANSSFLALRFETSQSRNFFGYF